MAWVDVPGSSGIWEYDNAPTLGTLAAGAKVHPDDQYYREANGTVTNGIRSFTPTGGNTQETYVKCRKVGNDYPTRTVGPWSELNKNYYDVVTTVSIIPSILSDAFVYLDAGALQSYSGSGATWSDLSGNNLDATLVGAPPYVASPGSFTLAGGDHATLPTGFANDFANGFGMFAIWNFGTGSNYERIIDLGQGQNDDNIIVGRKDTSDTFFYQLYNGATGGTFVEVPNTIQNSQFASYGVALNGTDGRLYMNGTLAGTQANYAEVPTNVSRNSNFIGKSNWPTDGVATGAMGVVLIFRRALTATEFATLHNAFAPRYGLAQVN